MKSKQLVVLLLLVQALFVSGLIGQGRSVLSLQSSAYPTGAIIGATLDKSVSSNSSIHVLLGVNLFDHRDLGVQDSEKGNGAGFALGYRRFFKSEESKWRWGIMSDVWWNNVEWETGAETGETDIVVIQPTAELSYVMTKGNFVIAPRLAFGMEWNVKTKGEPTGEGPILLLGIQLGRKL